MSLFQPNRRQLLAAAPLLLAPRLARASAASPSLNFLVVGDWGRKGSAYQRHVAAWMLHTANAEGAEFTVTTGDNFYNFGVSAKDSDHWQESFRDIYGPLLARRWYPTLGNHDYSGVWHAQLGTVPGTGWTMPWRNYVVGPAEHGFAGVELIMLDTVAWKGGNSFPQKMFGSHQPTAADTAATRAWLETVLSDRRNAMKIVFGHHPIHAIGPHGGRPQGMDTLEARLIAKGVSAYVCGHDHCLYHVQAGGLDHICSGGGSEELREYRGGRARGCVLTSDCPDGTLVLPGRPLWRTYLDRAGFALFKVDRQRLSFRFIDRDGLATATHEIARREPVVDRG